MNRTAILITIVYFSAFAIMGCKQHSHPTKYVITDGEEISVPIRDGISGIQLLFPKGYTREVLEGWDFWVYYYHAPESRGTIAFYIGHHPNAHPDPDKAVVSTRKFGVLETNFRIIKSKEGFFADALVEDYFSRNMSEEDYLEDTARKVAGEYSHIDQRDLHIMVTTNSEDYFQEAWTIFETAKDQ